MSKVTKDICKGFGKTVEEATERLQQKFTGLCIIKPEFKDCEKDYDAGPFMKDGEEHWWAKFTQEVEVDDEPVANHPQMAAKKSSNKKKAKVA